MMTTSEIRRAFLDYFKKKGHTVLPSASLIPKDPTILLNIAGMVPFKDYFLGKEKAPFPSAATCQKCIRTNDIEKVGFTERHHTFFEMLGNFSFGDYFKEGAIEYGWEFLTKILKLPEERLVVSIYLDDDEAYEIWNKKIGLSPEKIYRFGEEHNFWASGPTGPCGPDSEIFYDLGSEVECANPNCDPSCDCGRFVEVWNLVFMQYERDAQGNMSPLPKRNIDTGMGLERLASIVQGKRSNFEIDVIYPIIQFYEGMTGLKYAGDLKPAFKVLADHLRAGVFMISDGILPSNEGRGYILKRLLRRAIIFGKRLNFKEPFLYKGVDVVINLMQDAYPELAAQKENIMLILKNEETRFFATLTSGMNFLENELALLQGKVFPGDKAFKLYDTYGFPVELTREILEQRGLELDEKGFEEQMNRQRTRAKQAFSGYKSMGAELEQLKKIDIEHLSTTSFVGYEKLEAECEVIGILDKDTLVSEATERAEVSLILDKTPFYAESGGQVGDTGIIENENFLFEVRDTQKLKGKYFIHIGVVKKGTIKLGDKSAAKVDAFRRQKICANHTATHLLHRVLREVLGSHVHQAGSLVAPDRFRFDFTHFENLSEYQMNQIIAKMHDYIYKKIPVTVSIMDINEAKAAGAMALFDEKYTEKVRVVAIENVSMELCGGTHLQNTMDIGVFTIVGLSSIGAGLKRIEAMTGYDAAIYLNNVKDIMDKTKFLLNVSDKEVLVKLEELQKENKHLKKKIENLSLNLDSQKETVEEYRDINIVYQSLKEFSVKQMRVLSDRLVSKYNQKAVVVLVNNIENKYSIILRLSKDLAEVYDAVDLLKKSLTPFNGHGGGRKDMAQGGASNLDINKILEIIKENL